jgi:hypothetical protein
MHAFDLPVQASIVTFEDVVEHQASPLEPLRFVLHRLDGAGHLAAALGFWVLKARPYTPALFVVVPFSPAAQASGCSRRGLQPSFSACPSFSPHSADLTAHRQSRR